MNVFDPASFAITVWRNSPLRLPFRMLDKVTRQPLPLTGNRVWVQVREYPGATGDPLLDLSTDDISGDRVEVIDSLACHLALNVLEATLDDLPWPLVGRASPPIVLSYDLRYGPADSEVLMWEGDWILKTGVTRNA